MTAPTSAQELPRPVSNDTVHGEFVIGKNHKRAPKLHKQSAPWVKLLAVTCLCVASSAVTTWLILATGFIKPDVTQTITQNRDKLVLQEGEIVADVFNQVSPSTVAITTEGTVTSRYFGTAVSEGAGSGILISKDGFVLTNKHVIPDGTTKVRVILADGREFNNVAVVGRDPFNDIAFLKIQDVADLPAANIGDSGGVKPGQKVVAIGNALGEFRNSVTAGIISGLGRPVEASDGAGSSEKLENLFQTDAAINPGNSGGPLVNLQGEVIGINTAIAEQSQGIGFAIPINDAKGMIKTIIAQGKIIKPYLGVRYVTLTKEIARQLNITIASGAYIGGRGASPGVIAGSPAEKAGIRERDVIRKINDRALTETSSLASALAQFAPGDSVQLTIWRAGREESISLKLEAYSGH